ncbi:hypothetical protein LINPERPRIM_LOCUS30433 [Linum perenne]
MDIVITSHNTNYSKTSVDYIFPKAMDMLIGSLSLPLLIVFQCLIFLTVRYKAAASMTTNSFLGGNFLGDLVCDFTDCGNGKCKASTKGIGGFECECEAGWKTHKAAPYTFPACILPNCSVDLECDKSASPPNSLASILSSEHQNTLCPDSNLKPSAQPSVASPTSPTSDDDDACHMIWCGEGKCIGNKNGTSSNGSGYHCQCKQGATNMFNNASWACFKPCSLGSDCYNIPTCPQNFQSPSPLPLAPPPPLNNEATTTTLLASSILRLPAIILLLFTILHACL